MNELSELLKRQAVDLGLCEEWTAGWGNPDNQGLIDKFLNGINFCLKRKWPSAEFIKARLPESILHENNIFVDEDVQKRNMRPIAVLNGRCTGMLLFDGFSQCEVYLRDDSEAVIDCSRLSKVFITLYDQAKVKVIQRDAASVYVYAHGNGCIIETAGDVMIRQCGS